MVVYTYWMLVVSLLKQGIPYDVIINASDDEISLMVGINAAYQQKENEDMERNMAKSY